MKSFGGTDNDTITVIAGTVYYKGEPLHNTVTERIIEWIDLTLDPAPMIKFLARLQDNPSKQSRDELMLFLEAGDLPIQEDGRFLAYKVVRNDFKDYFSGKMDNSVGAIVEMERRDVNDNRQQTCSSGLHFCSREYIKSFERSGSKLVLLAIDPADVVSIPYDYNNAKGRACKYQVIKEVESTYRFDNEKSTAYFDDSEYLEDYVFAYPEDEDDDDYTW